jgi:hypothetical protein
MSGRNWVFHACVIALGLFSCRSEYPVGEVGPDGGGDGGGGDFGGGDVDSGDSGGGDSGSCAPPQQVLYTAPGCGDQAHPQCAGLSLDTPAVAVFYCGCDGTTITGGRGFAFAPYRSEGPCADGVDASDRWDASREGNPDLPVPPADVRLASDCTSLGCVHAPQRAGRERAISSTASAPATPSASALTRTRPGAPARPRMMTRASPL